MLCKKISFVFNKYDRFLALYFPDKSQWGKPSSLFITLKG